MGLVVTAIIIVHGGVGGRAVFFLEKCQKMWVSNFGGKRLRYDTHPEGGQTAKLGVGTYIIFMTV
jgi:hypothetical protein